MNKAIFITGATSGFGRTRVSLPDGRSGRLKSSLSWNRTANGRRHRRADLLRRQPARSHQHQPTGSHDHAAGMVGLCGGSGLRVGPSRQKNPTIWG